MNVYTTDMRQPADNADFSNVHLVHVVRQYHPMVGGLEDFVRHMTRVQRGRFASLRIVTLDRLFIEPEKKLPEHDVVDGIEVRRIPFSGSTRYPLAPKVFSELGNADLVHVHAVDFFFDAMALARPFHGCKLVATTHGGYFHTTNYARLKKVWLNTVTRLTANRYGAIACCSENDLDQFRTIAPTKARLIENGVDLAKFADAGSKTPVKRLVTLGRFSSNKRLERILQVMSILCADDPEWSLAILGNSSDVTREDLEAMITERGLTGHVSVLSGMADEALRGVLGEASLFVSASVYEGFGLAMIEAMAAGLVPVVHPNDAFKSLARKHPMVRLADYSQPETTAQVIRETYEALKTHPGLRTEAIASSSQHSWDTVITEYDRLYRDVLEGNAIV